MRIILLFIFLIVSRDIHAQTRVVGEIRNGKGQPVRGASLAIRDSYDGGVSDSTGRFSFGTSETGDQLLVITATGYRPYEHSLFLEGKPLHLNIVLKEEINEMQAVVITAGSFEASDRKKGTVLTPLDIVTTASANADVTGAIKTLPGTQQIGESEGLFVRGGTAGETRIFIDGTPVNRFFQSSLPNMAVRGRFSPFLFKGTVFSAGGYSALYGQALSSALILESIDLPARTTASTGISFLNLNAGYQHLSKDKKSSWGAGYGYTNLDLAFRLIPQRPDFFKTPVYHDGDVNFRVRTSARGILKYYGYFSGNELGFSQPAIDTTGFRESFRLSNFNTYHNFSWKEFFGNRWNIHAGISYTYNSDRIRAGLMDQQGMMTLVDSLEFRNFGWQSDNHFISGRAVLEKKFRGLSAFRFGGEYNFSDDGGVYQLFNGNRYPQQITDQLGAFFAETDIYLTNDLAAKTGIRVEYSSLLDKLNLAPRVSLAYRSGLNSQFSFAYGIFYQNPESRYLPAAHDPDFSHAVHYILQYQYAAANRSLRAEIFHKKYSNLLKTSFSGGRETAVSNNGSGSAGGIEIFWRDKATLRSFDYWVSYSFLDTRRDHLDYPGLLRPPFAARHTGSVVVKKFAAKLRTQFNASWSYASGRPYYNFRYNTADGKSMIADQGETVPYSSVSASVNYLPQIFSKNATKFMVLVFSVNNILNQKQVFGYRYSQNGERKEEIRPASRMFFFAGAFISFGVDRSQEAIDRSLTIRI